MEGVRMHGRVWRGGWGGGGKGEAVGIEAALPTCQDYH